MEEAFVPSMVGVVVQAKMNKTRPLYSETCNWGGVIKGKKKPTEKGGRIWKMPWVYKMLRAKVGEVNLGLKHSAWGKKRGGGVHGH